MITSRGPGLLPLALDASLLAANMTRAARIPFAETWQQRKNFGGGGGWGREPSVRKVAAQRPSRG